MPNEAVSLALLIEDMDAESKVWTHWSLYNIPAGCLSMEAGSIPEGAVQGLCNNFTLGYQGPCPKYFTGTHRYRITLLALSEWLPSANPLTPEEVWKQAAGSLLEKAELVGLCTSKEEGP